MQCTVLTSEKSAGIAEGLTYESQQMLVPGAMVRVPLRRKIVEGIVLGISAQQEQEFDVRAIQSVLSAEPLLSPAQIATARWMATYYCCTLRQVLRVWLPSPPWSSLLPQKVQIVRLIQQNAVLKGKKQAQVLDVLRTHESRELQHLRNETGASLPTIRNLKAKGILSIEEQQDELRQLSASRGALHSPVLTPQQRTEIATIQADKRPSLLFGVTSSGKTEIYAALIADAASRGKQSILLVPEIFLTEHSIDRFVRLLGEDRVAVLHSKLTPAQKREAWRKIREGKISLVVGSRSALFAPLHALGLVILDEEHEWTYKNEQTPRYHARSVAETLCTYAGAKLVLGSATPSLESWYAAKQGVYHLARLPERYNSQQLPQVKIIDLANAKFGNNYPLTPSLQAAIQQRLQSGEQSVLFLNHRGMASAVLCLDCRRRIVSPESSLPFTVHTRNGVQFLVDHSTGSEVPFPTACPSCRSVRLHTIGAGTQKLESILRAQFPQVRILRADSDSLSTPEQMREILAKMRDGNADILLGTQSVVKGLDLPNVTLAAVVIADIGLSLPHFRAGERVFQLLTQLAGRSGRAKPGEVLIQTFRPDAPEIALAAAHRTEDFLEKELKLRLHAGYPPVSSMIRLITRGKDAANTAKTIAASLVTKSKKIDAGVLISASPTLFGGGNEWHILLRGNNPRALLNDAVLRECVVDVDPLDCV